jgi:CRISPR-associated endoribonuclease Cas6
MTFRALSPITEMTNVEGVKHGRFLDLSEDWSDIIRRNLLHKYNALHGKKPEDDRLHWTWDREYIAAAEHRGKRLSTLTDIHGIKVRGWLAPFTVEGSRELIELGYEAGFGSRNSMGHGMAEKQIGE